MPTKVLELAMPSGGASQGLRAAPAGPGCGIQCVDQFLDRLAERLPSEVGRRAIELLRREPSAFVSVSEWANRLGIGREHLTRTLSPVITPHALILGVRQALAMQRLAAQDELHAGEALSVMGYWSRAHAFTTFRRSTGLTPGEWWRRHHKPAPGADLCGARNCICRPGALEEPCISFRKASSVSALYREEP